MNKLFIRLIITLSISLLLSGCQTELYTGLNEQEANEMLALLVDQGIGVSREPGVEQTINLSVNGNQLSRAIALLTEKGYPRKKFENMGSVFVKDGMISSPTEERARYNYAINQEVSSTLSLIDGVINARIHIVLPQENSYGDNVASSSASVFIKHAPNLNTENFIPKIKSFVSTSVEDLNYADVSVVLFRSNVENKTLVIERILGISMIDDSVFRFYMIFIIMISLLVALIGCIGYYSYFYIYRKPSDAQENTDANAELD